MYSKAVQYCTCTVSWWYTIALVFWSGIVEYFRVWLVPETDIFNILITVNYLKVISLIIISYPIFPVSPVSPVTW